jgi:hypothetical protein
MVWIKIDETLPWIELKGEHQTRKVAKKTAEETLNRVRIKIVRAPEKRAPVKVLARTNTMR